MKRKLFEGSTSVTTGIFVADSTSTSGAGLVITPSSPGLVGEYRREGQSSWTAFTIVTGTLGTYTSGGLIAEGSDVGAYEVGIPDAALAAGSASWVMVRYRGATNMLTVRIEIELDKINYRDGVRMGLTALPNAVAGASNGLVINGSNSGTVVLAALTVTGGIASNITGNITGNLVGTVSTLTTYTGNTPQTGDSFTRIGAAGVGLTAVGLATTQTFNNTGTWTGNIAGNLTGSVAVVNSYLGNTPQTGDAFARIGVAGAGLTALGDARIVNLDASVAAGNSSALAAANDAAYVKAAVIAGNTAFTVVSAASTTVVTVSGLSQTRSYENMEGSFTTGNNAGTRKRVLSQANSGLNLVLTFEAPYGTLPTVGELGVMV